MPTRTPALLLLAAAALAPLAAALGPPDGPPVVPDGNAWGWHRLFGTRPEGDAPASPAPAAPPAPFAPPPEAAGDPRAPPPEADAPLVEAPAVTPAPPLAPKGLSVASSALPSEPPGPPEAPARPAPEAAAPASAAIATASLVAAGAVTAGIATWHLPRVRRWLVGLLLPLYARLAGAAVLESDARERIHRHVRAHPGVHFAALKRDLDLRNGVLVHHLRVLERNGYVRSAMDGRLRRYFVAEGRLPEGAPPLSDQVYRFVATHPAATSAQVSFALARPPSLVHYHVARLAQAGQLRREKVGREVRLFAN